MRQVKRYTPVIGDCGASIHRIDYEEGLSGPFVRFEEYERLRNALEKLCRKGRCPIAEEAL